MKNELRNQYTRITYLGLIFLSLLGAAGSMSPALANSEFARTPLTYSTSRPERTVDTGEKTVLTKGTQTSPAPMAETSTAWLSSSATLSPVTEASPAEPAAPQPLPNQAAIIAALEELFKALETVALLSLEVHTNQIDHTISINISATINLPVASLEKTPGQTLPGKKPSEFMDSYLTALEKPELLMRIPEAIRNHSTPEDIAHYFGRHYSYETDQQQFGKEEYWQSPEEFLENKKGDCEDFALIQQALLKMNGYPSFLVNVYSSKTAHTVCVFKDNGTYGVIDSTDVKRFDATNIQDLFTAIHPFWRQGTLVTYSPDTKQGHALKNFTRESHRDAV